MQSYERVLAMQFRVLEMDRCIDTYTLTQVPDERGWEPASQPIFPEDGKVCVYVCMLFIYLSN